MGIIGGKVDVIRKVRIWENTADYIVMGNLCACKSLKVISEIEIIVVALTPLADGSIHQIKSSNAA